MPNGEGRKRAGHTGETPVPPDRCEVGRIGCKLMESVRAEMAVP